jgi:transcriptional regulator GlxA family with amidase domain
MDGRINYLIRRLINSLDHRWTVVEMADIVELSAPHFQKLFKIDVGISPIAFLRDLRLERAREQLENSFRSVKQIKRQIGISDDSHFTRDFKSKFGLTPTEYRKQYWGNSIPPSVLS